MADDKKHPSINLEKVHTFGKVEIVWNNSAIKLKIIHKIEEYSNDLVVNFVDSSLLCCSSDFRIYQITNMSTKVMILPGNHFSTGTVTAMLKQRLCTFDVETRSNNRE